MNDTVQLTAQQEEAAEKIKELMGKPMAMYNSARVENEIDLVQEVRDRLLARGMHEKVRTAYDTSRFIQEAEGKPSHAQQYNLNRFLSLQFMAATDAAQIQRYSLIYEINAKEWLEIFDATILPAMAEFDLPVAI